MWTNFTPEALRAIRAAEIEAARQGRLVTPAHLLLGALDNSAAPPGAVPGPNASLKKDAEWKRGESPPADAADDGDETAAARALLFLGVAPQLVRLALQTRLKATKPPVEGVIGQRYSRTAFNSLGRAIKEASRVEPGKAGTEHLLLSVARPGGDTLGLGMECLSALNNIGMVPTGLWESALRRARANHVVVPDVLAEFGLDLMLLRVAVASRDPASATPAWTGEVQRLVERARKEARATGAARVGAEHLWLGLLADPANAAAARLEGAGLPIELLEKHLRAALHADHETAGAKIRFTPEARRAFEAADGFARAERYRHVGSDHLLLALVGAENKAAGRVRRLFAPAPASRADAAIARALDEAGLPPAHLRTAVSASSQQWPAPADVAPHIMAIIARLLEMPPESVTENTPWPRLADMEPADRAVAEQCAQDFNIALDPAEFKNVQTVGDLARVVSAKLFRAPARPSGIENFGGKALAATAPFGIWLLTCIVLTLTMAPFSVEAKLSGITVFAASVCLGSIPFGVVYWRSHRFRAVARYFVGGWLALCVTLQLLSWAIL